MIYELPEVCVGRRDAGVRAAAGGAVVGHRHAEFDERVPRLTCFRQQVRGVVLELREQVPEVPRVDRLCHGETERRLRCPVCEVISGVTELVPGDGHPVG